MARYYSVVNANNHAVLAGQVKGAQGFFSRLCGLLGTSVLPAGAGLLLEPCSSIHMLGMRYALDVLFLSWEDQVLKVVENMRPGGRFAVCSKAAKALELPAGTISATQTAIGHYLCIQRL